VSDDGFEFTTAIRDGMSGPAHAEVAALGELDSALAKSEKSLHSHAAATENAGRMSGEAKGFMKEFTGSLVPEIALGEAAAEGLKKLGEGFVELGEKIFDFAKEGVEFALESAEFKENMTEAFAVVSGTAEKGEETYSAIEKMAAAHHLDIGKSLGAAKELALSGVENERILSDTVQAQGALQRVGLEAGAEKLRRLVEQSEAAGHLILPKKLGAIGFNMADLAKGLHETPAELARDLKAGKIEVDRGIAAIDAAILGGNVGQLAARKFDLTDVATSWHNIWRQLVEDVDAGPLTSALRNFVDNFTEGSGAAGGMKDEIVKDVNAIVRVLGELVSDATTLFLKLELGFYEGKIAATPMIAEIHKLGLEGPNLHDIGDSAEHIAKAMVVVASATALAVGWIIKLEELKDPVKIGGHEIGVGFVGGLVDGLTGGKFQVVKEVEGLGMAALDALRRVWQSHSPSRVAFDIGFGVGEGMGLGAEASSDRAARGVSDALSPPDFRGASSSAGPSTRNVTIAAGAVQIHIAGSSVDVEAMREVVENALNDAIDRVNLELGG
jgi:hypothetical protein